MELRTIIATILFSSIAYAIECTSDDFVPVYTECDTKNNRALIYYKKQGSTCEGGTTIPENVLNLPCDIQCEPGEYLPLGRTTCEKCPAGSSSIGSGYYVNDWSTFPNIGPFNFESSSAKKWYVSPNSNSLLYSGAITHRETTEMTLSVFMVADGRVSFRYLIESERSYDVFTFSIDNQIEKTDSGIAASYENFTKDLKKGYHSFVWKYKKDENNNAGEDRVVISDFYLTGLRNSIELSSCSVCPAGTYSHNGSQNSDFSGAYECLPCPPNTYSTGNSYECTPCTTNTYSKGGAIECIERPPCKEEDMIPMYGECLFDTEVHAPRRKKQYRLSSTTVCNSQHPDSITMNEEIVPCADCAYGTYRDSTSLICEKCPSGSIVDTSDGKKCKECKEGTASNPRLIINEFNTLSDYNNDNMGFSIESTCTGDCGADAGWRIIDRVLSSGPTTGTGYTTVLTIHVNLLAEGSFRVKLASSELLRLKIDADFSVNLFYDYFYVLSAGAHVITFTLERKSTDPYSEAAIFTSLEFVGVDSAIGVSEECTLCPVQTFSSPGSSHCMQCLPGTYIDSVGNSQCNLCLPGTFAPYSGALNCLNCDIGTSAPNEGASMCDYQCGMTTESGIVYDISGLQNGEEMIGPIVDERGMKYYINVCHINHSSSSCFDRSRNPVLGFACQITNDCYEDLCVGVNLGDVIGFYPLSGEYVSQKGLAIRYSHGTICPNGVNREMKISIVCDPSAGIGSPQPPSSKNIETETCRYDIVWKSIYGCPVCSEDDITYTYTPCVSGKRTKIARWKENPKRCHDGIELPPPETDTTFCSSHVFCKYGQYADGNTCVDCLQGEYSLGPALHFSDFEEIPSSFSTECINGNCIPFSVMNGNIMSGVGTARLRTIITMLTSGSVTFEYFLNSPGTNDSFFAFSIDDKNVFVDYFFTFDGIVKKTISVSEGSHIFDWTFVNGISENGRESFVSIQSITFTGANYSPFECMKCPAGTYQVQNEQNYPICLPCPENTYSLEGKTQCEPCTTNTYSYPGSASCKNTHFCTDDDFSRFTHECTDGDTSDFYQLTLPSHCVNPHPPSSGSSRVCQCPIGSFIGNDICKTCSAGSYYSEESNACEPIFPGYAGWKTLAFFSKKVGASSTALPTGWSTQCKGDCPDSGMRISSDGVSMGLVNEKRVVKTLTFTMAANSLYHGAFLMFDINGSIPESSYFDVYLNGIRKQPVLIVNQKQYLLDETTTTITLAYSQEDGAHPPSFTLSDLFIVGVKPSLSDDYALHSTTFHSVCSIGSISTSPYSNCSLCPSGTYQVENRCEVCPTNSYSPVAGASSCNFCSEGTIPDEGHVHCEIKECKFTIEQKTYDLGSVPILGPINLSSTDMLYISPCERRFENAGKCDGLDSHVCLIRTTKNVVGVDDVAVLDYGSEISVSKEMTATNGFVFTFRSEDSSECPFGVTTTLIFACSNESVSPRVITSDECTQVLYWNSPFGCPLCEESDYSEIRSSCSSGKRVIRMTLSDDVQCNGVRVLSERTESCSEVQMPYYWIFIVIGALVVLIAALVFAIFRHRRISQKYQKLIEHHPDELDEFDSRDEMSEEKDI